MLGWNDNIFFTWETDIAILIFSPPLVYLKVGSLSNEKMVITSVLIKPPHQLWTMS